MSNAHPHDDIASRIHAICTRLLLKLSSTSLQAILPEPVANRRLATSDRIRNLSNRRTFFHQRLQGLASQATSREVLLLVDGTQPISLYPIGHSGFVQVYTSPDLG